MTRTFPGRLGLAALLGPGLLAVLVLAGCGSGGQGAGPGSAPGAASAGSAAAGTATSSPGTSSPGTSSPGRSGIGTPGTGSGATSYRVEITRERGRIGPGADYTAAVPVLSGPDPAVVRRVDVTIAEYVRQEKAATDNESLHLTAGTPHVGAQVLALSFGGDRYPPGAAHPAELAAGLVFDLRTGERIRIEDVFAATDAGLRRLESIVRPELERRFPGGPTGGVTDPVPANYQQFAVNPQGLVVIVADLPYVLGPQSVLAPWDRLAGLVRPELAPVLRS
jgi:hypothetical protein